MCVIVIISFRKLDLTSQTSNICNILSPLYDAYFQQIALAVFKVVKQWLIWDFSCGFSCWTPGHGQKEPMKEGLSFRLSVRPIVCLSSRLAVSFLRISSFVFSETYYGVRGPYLVICDSRISLKKMMSEMLKKGQKIRFFGLFKENQVFSFVWNCCKTKVLMVL